MTQHKGDTEQRQEFVYRLDYYWKAIASYAIVLPVYALVRGTIEGDTFTLLLNDPVLIFLVLLIVTACVFALGNAFIRRTLLVGTHSITFRNRFRERTFTLNDIASISIAREKSLKTPRAYRVIRVYLTHRKRPLRIRPSLYDNDEELVQALAHLKRLVSHS